MCGASLSAGSAGGYCFSWHRSASDTGEMEEVVVYCVKDVAALLGCSEEHVRRLSRNKKMPDPIDTRGKKLWPKKSIDTWLKLGSLPEDFAAKLEAVTQQLGGAQRDAVSGKYVIGPSRAIGVQVYHRDKKGNIIRQNLTVDRPDSDATP